MLTKHFTCVILLLAGLGSVRGEAQAQGTEPRPNIPLQKTIGVATPTGPVPSLAVINSTGAKLEGNTLTLTGVSANSIVFADRPVRAAGHVATRQFIMQWDEGKDNFAKDPPNATISVLGGDGSKVSDAVVTLRSPKLDAGNLTFEVSILEGSLTGASGPAALFIDRFGGFGGGGFGGRLGGGDFGGRDLGGFGGGDRFGGGLAGDRFGGDARLGDARLGDDRVGYDRWGAYDRARVGGAYWHAPVYNGAWYASGAALGAAAGLAATRPYGYGYGQCGYYPYPACY
ncbi:hypothetical protein AB4099_21675 [Bosea sp. 2KB_26]|uniref:hypothetical protein n=1 Tax=Bosea sp. 2KB_26 TaxID=3237475 RepID=UPI003F8DDF89